MSNNIKVLLIGAGFMGKEYAKVLKSLNIDFDVITRTEKTAESFNKEIGIRPKLCDISELNSEYTHSINATSVESLIDTTNKLIQLGVNNILVEKPLFIDSSVISLLDYSDSVNIYVAYNRRYFSSTEKALEIIKDDGGLQNINFEFTEWMSRVDKTKFSQIVMKNWLIANSSHVIDLAFFFAGEPQIFDSYCKVGENTNIYVGSGITNHDVCFSYNANWYAPGRWSLELVTKKHRLYLKPMEKLYIQEINSVELHEVELNNKFDIDFKPGLYRQIKDFLSPKPSNTLKTLKQQIKSIQVYEKIMYGENKA